MYKVSQLQTGMTSVVIFVFARMHTACSESLSCLDTPIDDSGHLGSRGQTSYVASAGLDFFRVKQLNDLIFFV